MVATRNHPNPFPDPETATALEQESSPRKRTTRTSTANNASPTKAAATVSPPQTPTRTRSAVTTRSSSQPAWSHTPSNLTVLWLAISIPLVIWDTGYVLLRPHSMPGGHLAAIWYPYGMYGTVDQWYGFKAYNAREGWTGAQGYVNALETAAYVMYMYLLYKYGEQEPKQGAGAPDRSVMGDFRALSESRTVHGRTAAWAALLAYSAATVTCWKTILYFLIEVFGGFSNIGHNSWSTLLFFWGPMNIAWILVPGYMIYVFGKEIIEGLEIATEGKKSR